MKSNAGDVGKFAPFWSCKFDIQKMTNLFGLEVLICQASAYVKHHCEIGFIVLTPPQLTDTNVCQDTRHKKTPV